MDDMRTMHLLGAAKRLVDMRHTWNVLDIPELAVQDGRSGGTPYHHVTEALTAILRILGVTDPCYTQEFHDAVTTGEAPVVVLAGIKERMAELAESKLMFDIVFPADKS